MMLSSVSNEPNLYQIAAWQAAIFGAVFGAIIGLVNLWLGWIRQRREDQRKRAEAGYKLLDAMFSDEWTSELLYELDAIAPNGGRRITNVNFAVDFAAHFKEGEALPAERLQLVCSRLDSLLYYLDRFEHAIKAGFTDFEALEMPTGYYVKLLARFKSHLVSYISSVGYKRALAFLDRFPDWANAS